MKYNLIPQFEKDIKKLLKKYSSLEDDIDVVKKAVIELKHIHNIENYGSFEIPGFCNENLKICKIKKFACKSMKGKGNRSGIRVIYAYHKKEERVDFIEIYYKKKSNTDMDHNRAKAYLKSFLNDQTTTK